jgi:hypothetical protein
MFWWPNHPQQSPKKGANMEKTKNMFDTKQHVDVSNNQASIVQTTKKVPLRLLKLYLWRNPQAC